MIFLGIALAIALSVGDCGGSSRDEWEDDTDTDVAPEPESPSSISLDLPTWPPIGPDTELELAVSDADGLSSLEIAFRQRRDFEVYGTDGWFTVYGSDLGEGLGSLVVDVRDDRGVVTHRVYDGVLVDLTPPTLFHDDALLAVADAAEPEVFSVRMADGWVLGSLALEVDGELVHREQMPEGYPETTGSAVDATWVDFEVGELAPGVHQAVLTAVDAAGNVRTESLDLVLDGAPPVASIVSPAPDDVLDGWLSVEVAVTDDLDPLPRSRIFLGATELGAWVGPEVAAHVDLAGFLPGTYELAVVAEDEAGNVAAPVSIPVTIGR